MGSHQRDLKRERSKKSRLRQQRVVGTVSGPSGIAEPRERLPQPPPVIPEIISIPPSPEASATVEPEGVATLPMTFIATGVQLSGPVSVGPFSSTVPTLGVAKVFTLVPSNAAVTLNVGLAERLLGFILQPQDRRERSSHTVGETINDIFPQLLTVSSLSFH